MRLESPTEMAVFLSGYLKNHSIFVRPNIDRDSLEFHFIENITATEAIYGIPFVDIVRWNESDVIGDQLLAIAMEIEDKTRSYNASS